MDISAMFAAMDATAIDEFIRDGQEENLSLDFKTVRSSDLGDKNDKRSLARTLSGFANSSGGLVVWGVDARKNADDIDCAQSAQEISNVKQFVTRLNALTGEASAR